ncbi:esterase/lipase family protein [Streptomyces sp. NPDC012693]|jgi:triacylglycerol lipase|uniref:esterase/lipase family protein n=1 Tax=unclassified Streptomyces TaxID=2593676 RepID=UPI00202E9811|nr:alpha/beta fold hydrolase [Streptomyces sp. MSC1_001]
MRRFTRALSAVAACAAAAAVLLPAAPAQAAVPDPVLFVHGYKGGAWNFNEMVSDFKASGWPADRLYAMSYNPFQSNETTAAQIRDQVDALRARTGAAKVDVVTHSMGGLGSRWYLKFLGGTSYVDDWVSLGGPNHGTNAAQVCDWALASCKEMATGSTFLTALNSGDETPGAVNYGTFWSTCDELINPDSSTVLSGASNTGVGCVEHAWLLVSENVSQLTRNFVR